MSDCMQISVQESEQKVIFVHGTVSTIIIYTVG